MRNKTLRTLNALQNEGLIAADDLPSLEKVVQNFSMAITEDMQKLIDKNDLNDPIAKQFVPSAKELEISKNELSDPIGDIPHTAVKGIIHRYPDRCLFSPVHVCPIYCRFCFRREKVGETSETLSPEELDQALNYIQQHKEIWEVIITGGDPLILKPHFLKSLIKKLNAIDHVEVVRIHTRVPVVDPKRVSAEMIAALKNKKPTYIMLHANHPKEFTDESIKVIAALIDAGIPLLSQTVLLKDINDNLEVLSTLMKCFVKNRIKPYYLHHADLARGTKHFRTTIAEGQALVRQLRGRFSGICQPTYVIDIPGGFGKVPIGPSYLSEKNSEYCIEDYLGKSHRYSKE